MDKRREDPQAKIARRRSIATPRLAARPAQPPATTDRHMPEAAALQPARRLQRALEGTQAASPQTPSQPGPGPVRMPVRPTSTSARVAPPVAKTAASAEATGPSRARAPRPAGDAVSRAAGRATPPVGRGPVTPRTLLASDTGRTVSRPALPPADVLESDRILELPANRRTRTPAARPATPPMLPAQSAAADTRQGLPARALPRRGDTRTAGSAGTQSLGEALQGYVAVLAERRRRRQAGLDDQGQPLKATREPIKTVQPADVCPHCGGAGWLRLDLPFGHPQFGQPVPCTCKEQEWEERRRIEEEKRLRELDRFFSLDPFRDKTFQSFDGKQPGVQEAVQVAGEFAAMLASDDDARVRVGDLPSWLVLRGGYGTGKTHLAAAIAHYVKDAGHTVYFAVVPELLDHLRSAFAPGKDLSYDEMFDYIREVQLLVLDDLGAENGTAWATEKLFQLINYRYNNRFPTVITTNNQLQSHMDERVRSRLNDRSLVRDIVINAKDFRPRNARRAARG